MTTSFHIEHKTIGNGQPCFLIAEVAQAHDGSLGFAHSFIDAAADAGADAIKFQTHLAHAESTKQEGFRVKFSYEDNTRYDYWKRMEFSPEQWHGLYQHAHEKGLIFLSSAFSVEAVELLETLGVPAWKIGSGETNNPLLLNAMLDTGKPILLSTGMSPWSEIEDSVQRIQQKGNPIALFQCTSKYPTALTEVGLNVLEEFRQRFLVPIGLSDHTGTPYPATAAIALGAHLVEVHVTFHRTLFGPDVPVSLTFEQFRQLADTRDAFHTMQKHPVDKNRMAQDLTEMRSLFNKSVALKQDLPQGTSLTESMLTTKKPGIGIPATQLRDCIGKVLNHDVSADRVLQWEDLTNA